MCEKSSINILDEYFKKQNSLVEYNIITKVGGTHQNLFTCNAKCHGYTGQGTARSKKEAKRIAAEDMISKISDIKISDAKNIDPVNKQTNTFNTRDVTVSYINLLQELCIKKNLKAPDYTFEEFGPAHKKTFKGKCAIDSLVFEGSANTKKTAKHIIAKKMYCSLTGIPYKEDEPPFADKVKSVDEVDVVINGLEIERLKLDDYSYEKVKETYRDLLKTKNCFYTYNKDSISNYHHMLRNNFDTEKSNIIRASLLSIDGFDNIDKIFSDVFETIGIKIDVHSLPVIDSGPNNTPAFLLALRLNTNPVAVEIGYGDTYKEAERDAFKKMTSLLLLILQN